MKIFMDEKIPIMNERLKDRIAMLKRLLDKVVIITGATSGIGPNPIFNLSRG